ncbi:MAG: hypothetical protein MI975_01345 [Cytophagales bacterium]|nr:hypothetical protein [Cytophagales bacterium]
MKQLKAIVLFLMYPLMIQAQETMIPIHANWQFRQAGKGVWLPAEVPGTVHTDLLKNNKIDDPYFGTNEKDLQWIENEDWEYKTTFHVDSDVLVKDNIRLDFQGLDTYADVYLNDSLILEANNMFRSWQADVEGILKLGENTLCVFFHSPIKKTKPGYDDLGYTLPVSSNDQAEKKLSVFTRKAPYHFGWDWGPRFVTSGIWRPVELRVWNTARIADVSVELRSLDKNTAALIAFLEYDVARPFVGEIEILVDGVLVKKTSAELVHGNQRGNVSFEIKNPELWWPNGLGNQKLYAIEIVLKKEHEIIQSKKIRTGLRTIELVQEDDRHGSGFFFRVNGKQVFIKGANYIPQDNFLTRIDKNRYEHVLQSAVDANMNMIRVWGGGIYENEIFYDLCDEKGLLVWQDFMFSCAMYPGDSAFLNNIKAEAQENVKRLRHHPGLALWCGNNEILMMWKDWRNNANEEGNQVPLWSNKDDSLRIVRAYNDIFKNILPEAVQGYGNGVPYWESSPMAKGGGFDDWKSGDSHYWGVWWGREPFESYRKNIGRFMSEYGFQSFPELKTIKTFSTEEDWDIDSEVMRAHQRSSIGNKTIANYMDEHFIMPKDFESFLYLSQLLQAEGVKVAMEAHRIKKPYNMGSLVWQLNDCWPVASWSSLDYYGRWKALHYYIKKAFAKNLVAFESTHEEVKIFMVTDEFEDLKATLIVELVDFNGKVMLTEERKIKVRANSSEELWDGSIKELLDKRRKNQVYLRAKIVEGNNLIAENIFLFVPHKMLDLDDPNIKYDIIEQDGKMFVELRSDKTAFGVSIEVAELDLLFSDNYFTLHPKETKRIEVLGVLQSSDIRNKLTVRSLIDCYSN